MQSTDSVLIVTAYHLDCIYQEFAHHGAWLITRMVLVTKPDMDTLFATMSSSLFIKKNVSLLKDVPSLKYHL